MEKSQRPSFDWAVPQLKRGKTTRKWVSMNGEPVSADARSRLAAHIGACRQPVLDSVLQAQRPGDGCGTIAESVFLNEFLDQLTAELVSCDREPLDLWIDAAPPSGEASFHFRRVVLVCANLASSYAERHGADAEISAFLAMRGHEIAKRLDQEIAESAGRDEIVAALLETLRARDPYTAEHSQAVGAWCRRIAAALGLTAAQQKFAETCGLLHDVGKVSTPSEIIFKAGPLSDAEWPDMHAHARVGCALLEQIPRLRDFAPIVRAHHERVDGKGYPDRLAGEAIPIAARIVAVADAFHAMSGGRHYREALSPREAVSALIAGRGTQFDAAVVDALAELVFLRAS